MEKEKTVKKRKKKLITRLILSSSLLFLPLVPRINFVYFGASLMRTVAGDKKYINGFLSIRFFVQRPNEWKCGERLARLECSLSAIFISVISETLAKTEDEKSADEWTWN